MFRKKTRRDDGQADGSDRSIRPEYSVSPDDDLYGSPRSWSGAILRKSGSDSAESDKTAEPARMMVRGRPSRYGKRPIEPEETDGVSPFVLQILGSGFLVVSLLLVFHSSTPFATQVKQVVQAAMAKDYTSVTLPAPWARALGALPTSGSPAVSATVPPLDVVPPLQGRVIRTFSFVSPEVVIAGRPGSSIVAAADGLINSVGETQANGYYVLIDHGSFGQTFYAHLGRVTVHAHEYVVAGQTIGYLPSTSGDLTFGYMRGGSYRDPKSLLGRLGS